MSLPVLPGLWLMPYVRGRPVFAALAARALEEGQFDCVAVDLPSFLNPILPLVLDRLPLVTAMLIQREPACLLLPFVPTDPACAAAWLARERSLPWECVDDPGLLGNPDGQLFQPELPPPPPDLDLAGLEDYFGPLWQRTGGVWRGARSRTPQIAFARAAFVAARLQELLGRNRRVLLVCDYQLWAPVSLQLASGAFRSVPRESPRMRAALIFEDPLLLWAAGLFDEYPAVNLRFFEALRAGQAGSFDQRATLAGLLGEASCHLASGGPELPPGELMDRLSEELSPGCALECCRRLLEYPSPRAADAGDALPAYLRMQDGNAMTGEDGFELPDVLHCTPYYRAALTEGCRLNPHEERERRLKWAGWARPFLSRQEAKELQDRGGPIRWALKQDYRFHRQVCAQVRELVRARQPDCPALDEFTPVAFLFRREIEGCGTSTIHDSNPTQRLVELRQGVPEEDMPSPDMVYSVYYTIRAHQRVRAPILERELLTSLALLYTGEEMGPDRYAAISRRPRELQCRRPPDDDPQLGTFSLGERGVAWAVKYAQQAAIVVSHRDWRPSSQLTELARRRHVRLLELPLDELPAGAVERIQRIHYMSTALKKHPNGERIAARFVPPS